MKDIKIKLIYTLFVIITLSYFAFFNPPNPDYCILDEDGNYVNTGNEIITLDDCLSSQKTLIPIIMAICLIPSNIMIVFYNRDKESQNYPSVEDEKK